MKFRKKPIEIEAILFNGKNINEIINFCGIYAQPIHDLVYRTKGDYLGNSINIETKEGVMKANIGDWIIKEPFGNDSRKFYPCKPDIFEKTYEAVD